jgi:signal transduction histidine kinase
MDLLPTLLGISRSEHPHEGFEALVDGLANVIDLRCAAYVTAAERATRSVWPDDAELTADLLDTALHIIRAECFPLGSEFPFEAARFPDSEMLILPLHRREGQKATCILIADAGAFAESLEPWEELGTVLEGLERRCERLARAESECEDLRRRAEESEALHTLGLAANRTLDLDEVLNLVARFTRTLLGAHYVTVNTEVAGKLVTVAAVGLRTPLEATDDHHLARSVVEAEKPLTIGGAEANLQVANFPFHAREQMKRGVGIPLSLFGDTFGALIVGYRTESDITPRDTRLALTLAGHAAVAISNARLHERVEEHSRELKIAYDELNRLTAAKERFFASINHELRNPLSAVIGYQSLIMEAAAGELSEKSSEYLRKANEAANTLRVLVNDLLDLSKIAAGKMTIEPAPYPLSTLIDEALNTIEPQAQAKGISLTSPSTIDLPTIVTDAKRVRQILVNLLSNAVKFTDSGDVRLTVQWEPEEPEGGAASGVNSLEFRVTDSGPGISPTDLERVFEEFEQVEGSAGGTGLGLPIARRLARLLGGDLWAESELGRGSTFIFRIGAKPLTEKREGTQEESQKQLA